jgi:antitoxin component HigA of HigAB toxin-antitoxin module
MTMDIRPIRTAARHFPIDSADPVEAIKFPMDQQGLTPRDLEPMIGAAEPRL